MRDFETNDNNPEIDVEQEDLGEVIISKPYDPDKIRIDHQSVNLGALLEMLEYDEIDLIPDFQREGDLWSDVQKSQLIESVLLGLPLPSFYFSVDKNSKKWMVVDGLQRLSTFKSFCIDKTLRLVGLEFLESHTNKYYDELSRADLRKISGFKVNQYVIDKDTPPEVKFLIFKRVNTGGLVLTPQEMRHALNQGLPAEFIKKLSKLDAFRKATDYKVPSKRQEDRDFINRFVAFYILGYDENYEGELDKFLNQGMGKINELSQERINKLERDFARSMQVCYTIFGNDAFRKRYSVDDYRKPISKAVYDTISVNIALLSENEKNKLVDNAGLLKHLLIELFNDGQFNAAVSTGTGQKSKVKIRFEKVENLLQDILAYD